MIGVLLTYINMWLTIRLFFVTLDCGGDGNRKNFTSKIGKGEEEMEKKSRIQKMAFIELV